MKLEIVQQVNLPHDVDVKEVSQLCGDIGDQPNENQDGVKIFVNTKLQFQEMQGVGGSFSELGGKALLSLPSSAQKTLSANLFGGGMTYFRLPIGASDFALDAYSLNDVAGDFAMEAFSIARDEQYLLPYLRLAQQYCPSMRLHASPWSPPGWMKQSKEMCGGAQLMDDVAHYRAYALYFAKCIEAYQAEGFSIVRLNVQNEPDVETIYPSCAMPNWQMRRFIKEYLYPCLQEQGIETEIFGGTFRAVNEATACEFLGEDPSIADYIGGVGCQYSVVQALHDLSVAYPALKRMHTESNCFDGANTWEQAVALYTSIIQYINAGCDVFTYWNMILNETAKSGWGWRQNSLVNIDETTHTITYNPDYYVMQALACCAQAGAKRLHYLCRIKAGLAFEQPDGSVCVLVSNFTGQPLQASIVLDGVEHPFALGAMCICCVKLSND